MQENEGIFCQISKFSRSDLLSTKMKILQYKNGTCNFHSVNFLVVPLIKCNFQSINFHVVYFYLVCKV